MRTESVDILKQTSDQLVPQKDVLAIEAPLEIQLEFGKVDNRLSQSVSITMRTPGHDEELAVGFLFTEGILSKADVQKVETLPAWAPESDRNVVKVSLQPDVEVDLDKLKRNFYTTSSCGVCGKTSIDAVHSVLPADRKIDLAAPKISTSVIHTLSDQLRSAQTLFEQTGGIHAAGLFDSSGHLIILREDVGRHNALDKLIGWATLNDHISFEKNILMLSGRVSFELVQKAGMSGIPIITAVSAPSSLAISLASEMGITVLGFVRNQQFNVYSHPERIV